MIRLFKHYVPHTVLLIGAIDFVLLMLAAEAAWVPLADVLDLTLTDGLPEFLHDHGYIASFT